jgi:hypothetical protein
MCGDSSGLDIPSNTVFPAESPCGRKKKGNSVAGVVQVAETKRDPLEDQRDAGAVSSSDAKVQLHLLKQDPVEVA